MTVTSALHQDRIKSRKDREIGKASSNPVELGSLNEIPCHGVL